MLSNIIGLWKTVFGCSPHIYYSELTNMSATYCDSQSSSSYQQKDSKPLFHMLNTVLNSFQLSILVHVVTSARAVCEWKQDSMCVQLCCWMKPYMQDIAYNFLKYSLTWLSLQASSSKQWVLIAPITFYEGTLANTNLCSHSSKSLLK